MYYLHYPDRLDTRLCAIQKLSL